ncbi:hypothetical protein EKO27_g8135 [Xylaria grammica]|uniref:LysM domain-containing protein n=1 Tax=Xylaria grammica TaxID=363999 RepID=A0A439CXY3_9PEZI|nr:hypothetical protein EKO27_g8135 [Xylaria grammica]
MKPFTLLSSALALSLAEAYLVAPPGTAAPGASSQCSEWIEMSYGLTCAIIERIYGITAAEFEAWNPYVTQLGSSCKMLVGFDYCVQINFVSVSVSTSTRTTLVPPSTWVPGNTATPTVSATTTEDTTTTTSVTRTTPSMTSSSGTSTTTLTPTQSGMASNCNSFYLVAADDSCYDIATSHGTTPDQFYDWNPAVGSDCAGLWPDYYVCVGIPGSSTSVSTRMTSASATSTTTSGNGISTPTPIQSDIVSDCDSFYLVVADDGCYDVAKSNGITTAQFYAWNPSVGSDCAGLWPDYYVCVGTAGSSIISTSTTKTPPTTTSAGNGISIPTPTQSGVASNCNNFYLVVADDGCYDIATSHGITPAQFYAWNPAVGSDCAGLWPDYYVCVGTTAS